MIAGSDHGSKSVGANSFAKHLADDLHVSTLPANRE
jgi:hypothetical protein